MSVIYDPERVIQAASASHAGEGVSLLTSPPSPALPSVVTSQERGYRGHLALADPVPGARTGARRR